MTQVFISYSSRDSAVARQLHAALKLAGACPFLAEVDLEPGVKWKGEILENLRQARWVFFLATPNSCGSQAVAHEIGASLVLKKQFIPLMWGVEAKALPSWVDETHAIDLRNSERISALIGKIGDAVKSDQFLTGVVVLALIGIGLWVLAKE